MGTDSYKIYSHIRDELGYKDSAVATGSNITKSTFSDWKAGRYQPKDEKLQKIASFLGVTVEYLKTGNKPEMPEYDKDTLELIMLYSKLNKEQKSAVINMMRSFALSD